MVVINELEGFKKNAKKKIMIIANNDIWLYKLRKEIILKLLEENYEVFISTPNGDYIEELVKWGCVFEETQVDRRGTNPLTDSKLLVDYIRVLKKVKPDIVLAYTIKPNLYGGIACRILNIPYVNNITGLGSGFSKSLGLKFMLSTLYKVSLRKSACVFFQNTEDMRILTESNIVSGQKKLIPGSGVNLEEYTFEEFPENEDASFIFIGRIMKDKGIDQYLEASKIIKNKFPKTTFKIVGFVEESQSHYKELITDYVNKGFVSFHGFQTDTKPFIVDSHCIVQASHGGEGMSNVLLETASMGRVLIASNISGCKETIEEGYNGFTFKKTETLDLVEKIEKFISLPFDEKKMMGNKSRLKVESEFDRNIVVTEYMKVISKILDKK